ncbi:ABC transporter permease [Haloarcula mannanilytica]|uniref:ABC transporter permease n=1 Tax=Haloarcula mannanilytica TaxID=2509225 RepID=A0A4C2EI08_9EURY|nr:ABC transporter permease [Haloarcula mannanilytica]GCF14148.1 ABC transporter permease [Haloarcula mannanilytica]
MRYFVKRVGQSLLTIVSVVVFTFVMIRQMPGGPLAYIRAQVMQSRGADSIDMAELSKLSVDYMNYSVNDPIHVQLFNYTAQILQGDLGRSFNYGEPVGEIILKSAPWTIFLLTISIILTFAIGILLGAVMAYQEGERFDTAWTGVSMFLNSVPYFVAALLFVYVFAIQLSWFPASGNVASNLDSALTPQYVSSVLYHATLPIASLVLTGFGGIALGMRGNAIKEIGEEYIRVAHLRGVPGRRIAIRYVGRNAVLPLYTQFMISVGFMFGGSVILEQIFAYPGLGYYLLEGINARDYPLMMGIFIVITVAVVACILFADLTYGMIDPRVSDEASREAY